jgi:hypothetical protein
MDRVRLGAILACGLLAACGSRSSAKPDGGGGASGGTAGAAGQTGAAGAEPDAAGAAGSPGAAGADATTTADDDGDDATDAVDGDAGAADAPADAGDAADGDDGTDALPAILSVAPTKGCGTAPGFVTGLALIDTMGTKDAHCADSACGPWMYARQYYVRLPYNYDNKKVYPLVFEPISCGGKANNIILLGAVDETMIRVGLGPPPSDIGHSTNPNQGCEDDAEGDDSVEWDFYERLYDRLAERTCFDKNRVFVLGQHHGGTMADQYACKYAGDATRPIRGVLSDGGGLWPDQFNTPAIPMRNPTCSNKPLAAIWIDGKGNASIPFTFVMAAIANGMKADGCTIGTGFLDAMFDPFPIGGDQPDDACKVIKGCPATSPLVVCALNNNNVSNSGFRVPAFTTFLKLFESPGPLSAPPLP